jgi:NAD-reducing hydrogenase small subunit
MSKAKLATMWLDGCSGCHMSFLDMDELLLEVLGKADIVYGAFVDAKEFPEGVDVTLVEGAVGSSEDLRKLKTARERTRILVAFGDCAVTGNVPSLRNPIGPKAVLESVYLEKPTVNPQIPSQLVPELLEEDLPIHVWVPVDLYLTGCPPSAARIYDCVKRLLDGEPLEAVSEAVAFKFG